MFWVGDKSSVNEQSYNDSSQCSSNPEDTYTFALLGYINLIFIK